MEYKIEFLPTPDQMMALLDTGQEFEIVPATSHRMYFLYPKTETAEFTAEMSGIPGLDRSKGQNNPTLLIDVMAQWNNNRLYNNFEVWRNEFNKRRPYKGCPTIPKVD